MAFRLLSHEEFERLSTKERVEYLREAIRALDELKEQMAQQILKDTAAHIYKVAHLPPEQKK